MNLGAQIHCVGFSNLVPRPLAERSGMAPILLRIGSGLFNRGDTQALVQKAPRSQLRLPVTIVTHGTMLTKDMMKGHRFPLGTDCVSKMNGGEQGVRNSNWNK